MRYFGFIWAAVLALGGAALGCVFVCIAPFAAAATLAVATLSRRGAFAAIACMWLANQTIGFLFKHYPRDASTLAWGVAILVAAVVAAACASRFRQVPIAFLAAFAGYEGTLFAWSVVARESGGFTLPIVGDVFAANVVGFAILAALRAIVTASAGDRMHAAR